LVHPANGSEDDLLSQLQALLENDVAFAEKVGWNGEFAPSAIHRLDREVSGGVLVGVDGRVLPELHRQFADRETTKVYRAWCRLGKRELVDEGVWRYPLTRKAEGRKKPAGFHRFRVPCETHFKVIQVKEDLVEFELELKTGRKHQLRRHCALGGYSIVGDGRYGLEGETGDLLLHSLCLGFNDPIDKKRIEVVAPLPSGWGSDEVC
jgi:23S rRNA-/tRNA-specific pseudouridylate synthase